MIFSLAVATMIGTIQPSGQRTAPSVPEAHFVVVLPRESTVGSELAYDTRRVLVTMNDLGLLRYRPSPIRDAALEECRAGDGEPTAERRACLRRLLLTGEDGIPIIAIVVSGTRERSAAERMECVGPEHHGFLRSVFVNGAFHQRADQRSGVRAQILSCIEGALGRRRSE